MWTSELAEIISLAHLPNCFVSKKWHWEQSRSNNSSCLAQFSSLKLTNVLALLQQLWSEVCTYGCWISAWMLVFESACQGLLLSLLPLKTGDWIHCSASRDVTQIQWCAFPSFLSFGSLHPLFPWKLTLEFQTFFYCWKPGLPYAIEIWLFFSQEVQEQDWVYIFESVLPT